MDEGGKRRWFRRRAELPTASAPPPIAPSDDSAESPGATTSAPVDEDSGGQTPSGQALSGQAPADRQAMLARLSDYVFVQVRSGVYGLPQLRELTLQAAAAETDDPDEADELARQVLFQELQSWHEEADRWGVRTDCDRLDHALELIEEQGILVRAGLIDDESLAESIRIRGVDHGCVTFLVSDIWRALDTNTLTLTVIDSDGRPAGRRSTLVRTVSDALARAELLAGTGSAEGRLNVAMVWRRRPPQ